MSKVDEDYKHIKELEEYLLNAKEITYVQTLQETYKKVLVLSAASYFEDEIIKCLENYTKSITVNDDKLLNFVKCKTLFRNYHTFFDWKKKNTNVFWKLFGDDEFKNKITSEIEEKGLKEAEENFMKIGSYRNKLVHENFASHNLLANFTMEDIYIIYKSAFNFVDFIKSVFDRD
ncbi:HEPN domain-containing protein [uncultured Veillonella sp.]|uniref:HEPN domain-containing protein n=1 Tax=uncultured Veillonella sp. TaxID=159268 RepID=UPI00258D9A2B|nr:HEPN domain-containing protein [uncultured Veillonella sp.]